MTAKAECLVETMFWLDLACGASDTFQPGSAGPHWKFVSLETDWQGHYL